jgi:hypothetical protein
MAWDLKGAVRRVMQLQHVLSLQGGGFVAGFGMEVAELAPTSSEWTDGEMPKRFETKSGARGDVVWSG